MTIKVNFKTGSYSAVDMVNEFAALRKDGILSGGAVTEHSPANLSVDVAAATGIKNGYFMKSDASVNVVITSNTSGFSRIDTIALDMDNGSIVAVVGTPSSSPTPPALTGNKIALANVTVGNNVSVINTANISDQRSDVPLITDANSLSAYSDTGFYITMGTCSNIPSSATNGGILIHMARLNRPCQLFFDYMNTILYLRSYTGSWSVWEAVGTSVQKDNWHQPTFQNSWIEHNGSAFPVRYMKDSNGFVHLKGLIRGGAQGTIAFTLPSGYRAVNTHQWATSSNSSFAEVCTDTTGKVQVLVMSAGSWVSLDGITFPTF